ncbi:hypothetical protein LTR85_005893 [Meristemomyces frigidus]|nr:hypothetical protein LTR85_005893 [Meristemomyces frigidus]
MATERTLSFPPPDTFRDRRRPLLYNRLDFAHFETRFLRILDDRQDDRVRCRLSKASLLDPPVYTALSYAWGDLTDVTPVEINGFCIKVTVNLAQALLQLRAKGEHVLWIDAICINQSDAYEKSQQILRIGQIYSTARKVIAWLGPANADLRSAMSILNSDLTTDAEIGPGPLQSVKRLLQAPYFQRAWVIQEVAKAQEVDVWCGNESQPLDAFSAAAAIVGQKLSEGGDSLTLLKTLADFRKEERQSRIGVARMLLSEALVRSKDSLATDPRDKIYAMLGLTLDGAEIVPTPNYIQSSKEAFLQATVGMVVTQGQSAIMLLARGNTTENHRPSWVPDWAILPKVTPPWVIHSVLQSRKPLGFTTRFQDGVLSVRGTSLGHVKQTMESAEPLEPLVSLCATPVETSRLTGRGVGTSLLAAGWWASTSCLRWASSNDKLWKEVSQEKTAAAFALICSLGSVDMSEGVRHGAVGYAASSWLKTYTAEEQTLIQEFAHSVERLRCNGETLEHLALQHSVYLPKHDIWTSRQLMSELKIDISLLHLSELNIEISLLHRELQMLAQGILAMSTAGVKLAVTVTGDAEQPRAVHGDTTAGDLICRLENCPLPVVLRQVTREVGPVQVAAGGVVEETTPAPRYHCFVGEAFPQMVEDLNAEPLLSAAGASEHWQALDIV